MTDDNGFNTMVDYGDSMDEFEKKEDPYAKREPTDSDEDTSTLDYSEPPDSLIDPQQSMDEWTAMRGEGAQADLESCIWLVESFCPEKIEALSDSRNLSHDVELGQDLIDIYNIEMNRMGMEDEGLQYGSMAKEVNRRQHADVKARVEAAISNAEQRHSVMRSRYSK